MRSEEYERGYFVATQRAISRQELGLPLEYGKTREVSISEVWNNGSVEYFVDEKRVAYFEQAKTDE